MGERGQPMLTGVGMSPETDVVEVVEVVEAVRLCSCRAGAVAGLGARSVMM